MKKICKLLFATIAVVLLGAINSYASDEEIVPNDVEVTKTDIVAPVFDPTIQTRYTVKRTDEEKEFIPEELFGKITATDNVDGKDVTISLAYNGVNLAQDGEYQVMYTATDKAGNMSYMIIVVTVDGIAPTFDESTEKLYYMNKDGMFFDSKHNVVEGLPKTLVAKEALGAYRGIGVYITSDQNGNIIFVDMIKDTPAEKVLAINDILVGIDGEDVTNQTQEYAATKIKGEEGTTVKLDLIRNGENISVTVERELIKLYGEIDVVAEPNIDITSIKEKNGTIEITYTATDEVGNTAEFVVTVIIVEDETDKVVENENGKESEDLYNVTTSGNPPEGINLNIDDEKVENETDEDKTVDDEKDVEEAKDTETQEDIENSDSTNIEE